MNKETKKAALALLEKHPHQKAIHVTEDGNMFFGKHHAQAHAASIKSEVTSIEREAEAEPTEDTKEKAQAEIALKEVALAGFEEAIKADLAVIAMDEKLNVLEDDKGVDSDEYKAVLKEKEEYIADARKIAFPEETKTDLKVVKKADPKKTAAKKAAPKGKGKAAKK